MAEFIMKNMLRERGIYNIEVASAATSTEEIWGSVGNPIYPPAKAALREHNIPFDEHHAVQYRRSDYDKYDLIIGMDSANMRNIIRMSGGGDPDKKIHKLLEYCGETVDVSDPWYSGDFERAFYDIERGCRALIETLE